MSARSDSWYAGVAEEELWKLYSLARRGSQWFEVIRVAKEEMGLDIKCSRSGYYRWMDWMREQESERRLAQARIAALEADKIARGVGLDDDTSVTAYKSLAAELALKTGDAKGAKHFLQMALGLVDRQLHAKEIELKAKDLKRKDEELKIAQEKLKIEQAKSAKAVEAVNDKTLTDEERVKKVKSIFGIAN